MADTRHNIAYVIIEIKFDLHHNGLYIFLIFKTQKPVQQERRQLGSYWLELAILTFIAFVALAGNPGLEWIVYEHYETRSQFRFGLGLIFNKQRQHFTAGRYVF